VALRDIGPWLLNVPGFRRRIDRVLIDAACGELGANFSPLDEHAQFRHDWHYLLLSASVLAQSSQGSCQDAALRIAQTCLCGAGTSEVQKDAAALVLDSLANHPAIRLAEQRKQLMPEFATRLPGAARLEYARRGYSYSVAVQGGTPLRVNRFQRHLWDQIRNPGWMSVSAPTSAGKSFILARWIAELMREARVATVVYLVPTRALISQVERDLRDLFGTEGQDDVAVSSLPILRAAGEEGDAAIQKRVFVFTQERLHILLTSHPDLPARALIVDEAHKVGDRQRGVLLQDVIERLYEANSEMRAVFASPMTSNPGVLLADADERVATRAFTSEDVTVAQNVFWVSQRPSKPKVWDVQLCARGSGVKLGEIGLAAKPSSDSKRLSFIAHAIGGGTHGNIVYVNGAAEAEKIAAQLFDLRAADVEGEGADELRALVELAQHVVHKRFALTTCLRRGVAFHYGNMPLLIREEIERLFSAGTIKFLVCTSTLIEGVNMACRNIFMRGPQKGRGRLLSAEDFWNLAGRAGRWGKEFQGNIFCIDPDWKKLWGEGGPPRERGRQPIRRTTDDVLTHSPALIEFIKAGAPLDTARERPEFEYVFSYLASIHVRHGGLLEAPWAGRYDVDMLAPLAEAVKEVVEGLAVEPAIVARNPGVSPFALDDLLKGFRSRAGDVEELLPADPSASNAAKALTAVFGRLCRRACPRLGPEGPRAFVLALLVTQWMRGYPLSRLIDERIKYHSRRSRDVDEAAAIRGVMDEVEQIARFEAPRGLSCYCDVLKQHLREIGRQDLLSDLPQFNVLLELGVSQQTQISLMGLGLSRTSAIAISEKISADDLTELQAVRWLVDNEELWRNFSVPALVKREIERVTEQHRGRVKVGA
jgi:hypothetical protein